MGKTSITSAQHSTATLEVDKQTHEETWKYNERRTAVRIGPLWLKTEIAFRCTGSSTWPVFLESMKGSIEGGNVACAQDARISGSVRAYTMYERGNRGSERHIELLTNEKEILENASPSVSAEKPLPTSAACLGLRQFTHTGGVGKNRAEMRAE